MTAPVDAIPTAVPATKTPGRSRRALLAGALGGLGAWAASAVGRATPVRADGETMTVGGYFDTATDATRLINLSTNAAVFMAKSEGPIVGSGGGGGGVAVTGESESAFGLLGSSLSSAGVHGVSDSSFGVEGNSGSSAGVRGRSTGGTGVHGTTDSTAIAARGVHGVVTSTSPGSFSAGVRGDNNGTGGTGIGVMGTQGGSGWGVYGTAPSGRGVYGLSTSGVGVYGQSDNNVGLRGVSHAANLPAMVAHSTGDHTGMQGFSGSTSAPAAKPKTGVYGYANQDSGSKGVWGFSGRGAGVYGQSNKNGFALRANGRIKADKVSGVATIRAGNTSVTVTPNVNVTSGSFVLLTPKANIGSRGLWFTTNASADTFTIRMSSSRSSNTKVAWLLLG